MLDRKLADGLAPFPLRSNSNSNAIFSDALFSEAWACLFLLMLIIVRVAQNAGFMRLAQDNVHEDRQNSIKAQIFDKDLDWDF